jgi:hypothetical protein
MELSVQLKAPASLPSKKGFVATKGKFLIHVSGAYELAKKALLENMNTASMYTLSLLLKEITFHLT